MSPKQIHSTRISGSHWPWDEREKTYSFMYTFILSFIGQIFTEHHVTVEDVKQNNSTRRT